MRLLYAEGAVNIAHCRYQKPSEDAFFMPHAAVTYVRQGRKVVCFNGRQYEMKAGDALFIPKNTILYSDILVKREDFISVNMTIADNDAACGLLQPVACRLTDRVPLEELARGQHMSLSTFKRRFRRHTGASPGQWVITKRLERARYLLAHKQLPVTAACFESGFEDLSYFIRRYRRQFGHTPGSEVLGGMF
ncbi:AraC family transcriptional regulator [Chitinophaga alhagiae]|uniref:AraC family transcriptional regulator n=1 Tax=Chitinophaga alhagiae TaxID=2203219 RepID=UPI00130084C1|nr:AraC family transcriptional regulator [Chitinophaga alhagiae]